MRMCAIICRLRFRSRAAHCLDEAKGRLLMRKSIHFFTLLAIAVAGMLTLSACGGGGGGNHPTINDVVVLPGSSSVGVSQTAQFSAFLGGASTSVTWTASAGTIDGTGLFTAPTAPASVTITATSGSNTGTATVNVVSAPALVVNPAALTIPAGGLQSFTATPSAGVIWSVNGIQFGDCVAPPVGTTTQCHGTIDGNGNYTAPLSPPTGQTVAIGAAGGGNSGTSTATVLYSSASLTTSTIGTGQYAVAFNGIDFTDGFPVDVAGSIFTSGSAGSSSGTIIGGEMDLNTGEFPPSFGIQVTGGTFQVGPLDGRTSIVVTLATNNFAASLNLQATLATNQHALLIDFDSLDTGSGTLDAQSITAFAAPLNSRFAFQFFGIDQNLNPVTVAGTFLDSNNTCQVNNPNSPVNTQDFSYVPLNTNTLTVVTNDITLSGICTGADAAERDVVGDHGQRIGIEWHVAEILSVYGRIRIIHLTGIVAVEESSRHRHRIEILVDAKELKCESAVERRRESGNALRVQRAAAGIERVKINQQRMLIGRERGL